MTVATALMLLAALAASAALAELAAPGGRRGTRRRGPAFGPRAGDHASEGWGGGSRGDADLPPHPRWAARSGADERIERLLDAAGRVTVADAEALAAQRRVAAAVGAAWALAIGGLLLPAGLAIGAAFAGAGIGRALPGLLLHRAGRRRAARLREELPELLELLAVALGCGLPVRGALAALGDWGEGPLAAGAGRAAGELARGAGTEQTLRRLVRDHPVAELESAVAILERSRRHGTPAAEPLRALAAGAREGRARRAMDHAAKASPRVQLVAALLLVPAALCVLAAALVAGGIG